MGDQIPWTGGISNRQIVLDTARGVTVWAAVATSLFMLVWWISGYVHVATTNWKGPACAAFAGVLSGPIARWCRTK